MPGLPPGQDRGMGWVIGLGIVAIVFILAALSVAPWLAIVPALVLLVALVVAPPFLAARERPSARGYRLCACGRRGLGDLPCRLPRAA